MRSNRIARAVVLLFLVVFATAIGYRVWRASSEQPAVVARPATPPPPVIGAAEVESTTDTFQFTEEKGGVVTTRLSAGRMLGMQGGSRLLSDILIELRPDETRPERVTRVQGDSGDFDPEKQEIRLRGQVQLQLAEGQALRTRVLHYSVKERRATAEGPVSFEMPEGEGTANGLEADFASEQLTLRSDVQLFLGDERRPLGISAEGLVHDGATRRSRLTGRVELTAGWGRFRGEELVLIPEGSSHRVESTRSGRLISTGSSETFELSGGHWVFHLDSGNGLREVVARVQPALRGEATPLEHLTAETIRMRPEPGGGARLLADTRVRALLQGLPVTEVESSRLEVSRPGGALQAHFSGDVTARGPERVATGEALTLQEDRSVELSGSPARLTEGGHAMAASSIHLSPDGEGAASGGVEITVDASRSDSRSLLPAADKRQRIVATADTARFISDGESLRLEGSVTTWQGTDSIESSWLTLDRGTGQVEAGGGVTASVRPARAESAGAPRVRVRSRDLRWREEDELAVFSGDVHLVHGDARVDSEMLHINTGQRDRTFKAEGSVKFANTLWEGEGDRLTYLAQGGSYLLEGLAGSAEVRRLDDGSALSGRTLRVDPGGQAAVVSGGGGGRVSVRSGEGGR